MAVDDGGEWLVVVGARAVVGHAHGGAADIGLFADVDARHVLLELVQSFHGGAGWHVGALGRRALELEGAQSDDVAPGERAALVDGARVVLAPKLSFVFHRPDPASASAVLALEHGAEAEGAQRVLLLTPGPEGRARIGLGRTAHVPLASGVGTPGLGQPRPGARIDFEVEVEAAEDGQRLKIRCARGVRVLGEVPAASVATAETLQLDLPLTQRLDLAVGARAAPPFVIALAPPSP